MTEFYTYIFSEVRAGRLDRDKALVMLCDFDKGQSDFDTAADDPGAQSWIHPMLQRNTSTMSEQRYSSIFTGAEPFLADHRVNDECVLPGAAYIEMARAAVSEALELDASSESVLVLENIVFLQPLIVAEIAVEVHICLTPKGSDSTHFEIVTEEFGVHAQGCVTLKACKTDIPVVDLDKLQKGFSETIESKDCYERYASLGLVYGPSHRAIKGLRINPNTDTNAGANANSSNANSADVVASVSLPEHLHAQSHHYGLHPSLLDAALQATIGSALLSGESASSAMLPFAIDSVELIAPLPNDVYVLVRSVQNKSRGLSKFDIDIVDIQGRICARIEGFSSRKLIDTESDNNSENSETILLQPVWKHIAIDSNSDSSEKESAEAHKHCLILVGWSDTFRKRIQQELPDSDIEILNSNASSVPQYYTELAAKLLLHIQALVRLTKGCRLQLLLSDQLDAKFLQGLSGMIKSASREHEKFSGQVLSCEEGTAASQLASQLIAERRCNDSDVRYRDGQREILCLEELGFCQDQVLPPLWREQGVYLISGGIGGLGQIFAKDILRSLERAHIILTGRSKYSETIKRQLAELKLSALGMVSIEYHSVDISDENSVSQMVSEINASYGPLTGVIHSAGIISDGFIMGKTAAELRAVFEAKVSGLVALDQATKDQSLELFVCFSSTTAVFGNVGQSDYAAANAFMDAYMLERSSRVEQGNRCGKSLSINWPLWKEGGMQVDAATADRMLSMAGLMPMPTQCGIHALAASIALDCTQMAVLHGKTIKREVFASTGSPKILDGVNSPVLAEPIDEGELMQDSTPGLNNISGKQECIDDGHVLAKLKKALIREISLQLKVDIAQIDEDAEFSEFGFDSVTLTGFGNSLNHTYGFDLTPTLFFEFPCVALIGRYLIDTYPDQVGEHFKPEIKIRNNKISAKNNPVKGPAQKVQKSADKQRRTRFSRKMPLSKAPLLKAADPARQESPIAIVGLSACLPKSENIDAFWQNLKAGRDCIGEVPASRWDWETLYGDPETEENKTNIKFAGVMEGIDLFDPLFFGISPREAKAMDPHQRLLMTHVWKAIEDSGHAPESLSGSNTGLFIATAASGYSGLLHRAGVPIEGYSAAGMVGSVGPNRMSYLLNLHGPSEPIETACSSSLVALHRAVSAIHAGQCDQAVVGGVNILVSPESHISFNKAGMLSSDGRCKSFSRDANGYVRGEGVGMLMLKPLAKAEADGDHIYALVRGSSENHGGRANSLTAPNPRAQAELIKTALRQSGVDPASVNYIEAHGTGTSLGDPIEVRGLKSAFAELAEEQGQTLATGYCGLGSVKSNIGHLELAAGIAGIIKVLLQMKHRQLVPSLHCDELNPYIDLKDSPFEIVRETKTWEAVTDTQGNPLPRRAGVSSFGFGGVNAHVVLEEYCAEAQTQTQSQTPDTSKPAAVMIVVSAKTPERLQAQVQQLNSFILHQDLDLHSLAYTLQVGRDAMGSRFSCVVRSIDELQVIFKEFLSQNTASRVEYFSAEVKQDKHLSKLFEGDEDLQIALKSWLEKGKLEKLCDLWVRGLKFDWSRLYVDVPQRISLPTYPFIRDRYWVDHLPGNMANTLADAGIDLDRLDERIAENTLKVKSESSLSVLVQNNMTRMLSELTNIPRENIECDEPLESYGIDSVIIAKLNHSLGILFPSVAKTLFYECPTVEAVAERLVEEDRPACLRWCEGSDTEANTGNKNNNSELDAELSSDKSQENARQTAGLKNQPKASLRASQQALWRKCLLEEEKIMREPIAIIGLDGRYAKSKNLDEFWSNLKNGVDCIEEIPSERWSVDEFYDADKVAGLQKGKSYSKWGGFIDGFSEFDPMFFNIIPREAQNMDPQERIFLQMCWSAVEDAGYSRERLAEKHQSRVGVFAGITKTGFAIYGPDLWKQEEKILPNTSFSSVANRVSYVLNLRGPSMPIDTMCSASLTAIHEACEHIYRGECELALAGGVNLYLHPSSYFSLCAQQMLSADGKCKSFGDDANGFAPGEGVGAVLLKRLSQAEADGDHIYGVIRGTSVNHGGKTNGYTVPNPHAHTELISEALAKAEVHPRTVSYVEAHGTGTSLGDPIEVTGLTKAFRQQTSSNEFCALGSVKSNIGHCESAAGISGLSKILLQMKHGKIVPSLHSQKLNTNIEFSKTPFVVPQELMDWKRPVVSVDGEDPVEYPRIAGLSSFGAGGSNAHIIVEEYVGDACESSAVSERLQKPISFVLSAKNSDRLWAYANNLNVFLDAHKVDLMCLAYTLQKGREAMATRLAFSASSMAELKQKLLGFLEKNYSAVNVGEIKPHKKSILEFKASHNVNEAIALFVRNDDIDALQKWWVKGLDVDWDVLWPDKKPHCISLPTYPFSQEKYWLPKIKKNISPPETAPKTASLSEPQNQDQDKVNIAADATVALAGGNDDSALGKLVLMLSQITEIPADSIDGDVPLDSYGIDSIIISKLNQKLGQIFEGLSKTLFYEYLTLLDVADFLSDEYPSAVSTWCLSKPESHNTQTAGEKVKEKNESAKELNKVALEIAPVAEIAPAAKIAPAIDRVAVKKTSVLRQCKDNIALKRLLLTPQWENIDGKVAAERTFDAHYIGLCAFSASEIDSLSKQISIQLPGAKIVCFSEEGRSIEEQYSGYAAQTLSYIQQFLAQKIKTEVRLQLLISAATMALLNVGLTSLLKSAHYENPKLSVQLLTLDEGGDSVKMVQHLAAERLTVDGDVRYLDGHRQLPRLSEQTLSRDDEIFHWKDNGVYLITGGAGGLGLMFSEHIASRASNVTLVLSGRSQLADEKRQQLARLKQLGATIEYRILDVSDAEAVSQCIEAIIAKHGKMTGLIHSAGVLNDGFIFRKTEYELRNVFAPKVNGVVALDEATKALALDVFICFSSTAGTFGNVGQADYAAANAFLDTYCCYRNELVERGERQGRSLSINWPLWADGGMQIDENNRQAQWQGLGLVPLEKETGLHALDEALSMQSPSVVVLYGDATKIRRVLLGLSESELAERDNEDKKIAESLAQLELDDEVSLKSVDYQGEQDLQTALSKHLAILLSDITQLDVDAIDVEDPLEDYGVDSVVITQLNHLLEQGIPGVSKTLFYEYPTLVDVARFLADNFSADIKSWLNFSASTSVDSNIGNPGFSVAGPDIGLIKTEADSSQCDKNVDKKDAAETRLNTQQSRNAIAVVGLAGRYPKSDNLAEYWDNLKNGVDCIEEIPQSRWRLKDYYIEDPQAAIAQGKSYCKWGGLLGGVVEFDTELFNIPLREAEKMDPQERIFIESCWSVFEDAGYNRKRLEEEHGNEVGVFVGITKTGFELFCPDLWRIGAAGAQRTSFASVANRVSYLFNLNGPSMPVDTMCSSSLTAIHQACQSLINNECQLAVAGGVNLYLHNTNYSDLCGDMMLSSDGKCKSYGAGANGFVPGEGVGTVLLKRLEDAEADGDHIYGVIRATNINHCGKTNGYRVPNPNAHHRLIRESLKKANILPRAVSYVEGHGTGTSLGDPIEVTGLTKAFYEDASDEGNRDYGFCSLGSVKANIGHCESAAGIAGLTKILLQLKHRQIVPSLNSQELNPNIDFSKSPFRVPQKLESWDRPVLKGLNGKEEIFPRIACLSSFGAGGANAHLVVEEYINTNSEKVPTEVLAEPHVFVLSASNESALRVYLANIVHYLKNKEVRLGDVVFTLQQGRNPMSCRFACVVQSKRELLDEIGGFISRRDGGKYHVSDGAITPPKSHNKVDSTLIDQWCGSGDYEQITRAWVTGCDFEWSRLFSKNSKQNSKQNEPSRRYISLPTYPFEKTICWPKDMLLLATQNEALPLPHPSVEKTVILNENSRIESTFSSKLRSFLQRQGTAALAADELDLLNKTEVFVLNEILKKLESQTSESKLGLSHKPNSGEVINLVGENKSLEVLKASVKINDFVEIERAAKIYIEQVFIEHIGKDAISDTDSTFLTSLGMDSISAISVKRRLYDDIAADIDPTELINNTTIKCLLDYVMQALGVDTSGSRATGLRAADFRTVESKEPNGEDAIAVLSETVGDDDYIQINI